MIPARETSSGLLCIEVRVRLYHDGAMSKLLEALSTVRTSKTKPCDRSFSTSHSFCRVFLPTLKPLTPSTRWRSLGRTEKLETSVENSLYCRAFCKMVALASLGHAISIVATKPSLSLPAAFVYGRTLTTHRSSSRALS